MKEQIGEYYLVQKQIFDEQFHLVIELFDKEAIHKMRTTTKRLRALFQLTGYLSGSTFKPKKQLKKVRNLFKLAGRIRELQIEQQLVEEYEKLIGENYQEYLEYLRTREFREISRFLKQLPVVAKRNKILRDDQILASIDAISGMNMKNRVGQFIDKKRDKIHSRLSKPISTKRIHRTRTSLKQLFYLAEIAPIAPIITERTSLAIDRIRETEQYIGTWHDLVNSSKYLESFFKTKNSRNVPKYEKLKAQIVQNRKQMRKTILKDYLPDLK